MSDLPGSIDGYAWVQDGAELEASFLFGTKQKAHDFGGDYYAGSIIQVRIVPTSIERSAGCHPPDYAILGEVAPKRRRRSETVTEPPEPASSSGRVNQS